MWEQHNVAVPNGYLLRVCNGNPLNCDITNLEMVSLAENAQLNKHKVNDEPPELRETAKLLVKLRMKSAAKQRELDEETKE